VNDKPTELPADQTSASSLTRRRMFAGAGTVTALAAVAAVLPGTKTAAPALVGAVPETTEEGYRLSEHIKRYYQTARV
jgi:hypothetical protein